MRESWIETVVTRHARKQGWLSIKLNGPGGRGKPDRLYLAGDGRVMFIEFKAPGRNPTKLQRHWLDQLREMGFECHVIDDIERGCELF